ncbi:Protein of unknown function [Pyronema omphalodes CBS 100304]|uniref:Uncharacterized protein n=1 Tax=Pyronema omphalodes (strain CBS 100304) TaxID=1076935 RepID=U4L935_PYROM|nr:Protein of unknown function [Pyronema omphalodes CBS 100304]
MTDRQYLVASLITIVVYTVIVYATLPEDPREEFLVGAHCGGSGLWGACGGGLAGVSKDAKG